MNSTASGTTPSHHDGQIKLLFPDRHKALAGGKLHLNLAQLCGDPLHSKPILRSARPGIGSNQVSFETRRIDFNERPIVSVDKANDRFYKRSATIESRWSEWWPLEAPHRI